WLGAADGGCGAHRLSRARSLDGGGLRLGQVRGLLLPDAGGPGASRQHGRPEIHSWRVGSEDVPRLVGSRLAPLRATGGAGVRDREAEMDLKLKGLRALVTGG